MTCSEDIISFHGAFGNLFRAVLYEYLIVLYEINLFPERHYVIIDIWDRSIVKWSIHEREDDELANELFHHAFRDNDYPEVFIHSDNGNPMKCLSLMALFNDLGICNSYSRPRVSNDNPFIESWFKTMK
ncbi:MAG: hypothetical protein DRP60_13260, partial [Spirochaetes bacterium]